MGDALKEPVTTIGSSQCENSRFLVAASSVQGWRTKMEDSHCHVVPTPGDPTAAFFGVFDGHNGANIAKYAADHLHDFVLKRPEYRRNWTKKALELMSPGDQRLYESTEAHCWPPDIILNLKEGFLDCDAAMRADKALTHFESTAYDDVNKTIEELKVEIQKLEKKESTDRDSAATKEYFQTLVDSNIDYRGRLWSYIIGGSTANTVFIKDDRVYCANAGDSRAVASVGGRLLELSQDHKPLNPEERARIEAAGAQVTEAENRVEGLALSRAFGDYWQKRHEDRPPEQQIITAFPEVRMRKLKPDWEFILMACDGVWDTLTSQEAVSFVRDRIGRGERPQAITEALVKRCLGDPPNPGCRAGWGGPGCDNITALLVCFLHDLPYEELSSRCRSKAKRLRGTTTTAPAAVED